MMNERRNALESLSIEEKRQLLAQALKKKANKGPALPLIVRRQVEKPPLSFAQQRLWFLDQLGMGKSAYNVPMAVRLQGLLKVQALEQSLQEVVKRHEVLRTTFAILDDQPVQIISPVQALSLTCRDLSALNIKDQEEQIQQLVRGDRTFSFDLSRDLLLHAVLLRLSRQDHILLLIMHHIVADGWSVGVLIRELSQLYPAFVADLPSPLPPLSLQYADYAIWQRQSLQGQVLERHQLYWQKQLAGFSPTRLLTDYPRPPVQSFYGASQSILLSAGLTEKVKELSQREGVTLFMTLLAAFKVLLFRYTGQEDVVVGTPIANRTRPELEGLIGFFVNMLVLRTQLAGRPSFREVLARVREVTLEAYNHQDFPFEKLVDLLKPERDLAGPPLFQIEFSLQNTPLPAIQLADLSLQLLELPTIATKFDLSLQVMDTADGLLMQMDYNADLFAPATIERLQGHWHILLKQLTTDPEQSVVGLSLLTQEEQQLLTSWNATHKDYPQEVIHQLFEAQVQRTPDALALVFEEQQLTYRMLNARANQLARFLQKRGVGAEMRVAVCMERSLALVISLLAILKTGASYVPLDPDYPRERLAFMLANAHATVLLTQQQYESLALDVEEVICLDVQWYAVAYEACEDYEGSAAVDSLAYVIYTSGSTGRPKGVMISHRALCNRLLWMQEAYRLTEVDRVLQKTAYSFDVSVWEFFWPLIVGASLVLAQPGGQRDSGYLVKTIIEQSITTISFVPSLLQVFLQEENLDNCSSLRHVICSGEALPLALLKPFFAHLNAALHNLYGPTEAAIDVTFWECERDGNLSVVPIGRPIANMALYVLDAFMQRVPVGVPGELYIGGVGLARGYLSNPELTAGSFVPHPFADEPGARLYKTGDQGRYRADGALEFMGRLDHQVKIRGYRIELGEVEVALCDHPAVREAIVVAREDSSHHKRLVAYFIPALSVAQRPLAINELRQYLLEKLPEYMVPAFFVPLEMWPVTSNGKLDRRALPAPEWVRASDEFVAPRTTIENMLADIWRDVLGIAQIGVHDNFFDLGGDSILTIQIVSRARKVGLHLMPRHIFEHQTIEQLSLVVSLDCAVQEEQGLVTGPVPLTPIQHYFFSLQLPNPHYWNQSMFMECTQRVEIALLAQALKAIMSHHDALRMRFEQSGGEWVQINKAGEDEIPLSVMDLSCLSEAMQDRAIEQLALEFQQSLHLARGPLCRVVMFELGTSRHQLLLIIIHHLIIDGVSWRILAEDLQTAYLQLKMGKAPNFFAKTTSFKRWAELLIEYSRSDDLLQKLTYWLNMVHVDHVALPLDYPMRLHMNTEASACVFSLSLTMEETQALLREVMKTYRVQMPEILLAVLLQVWMEWSSASSLLLDVEGHGRDENIGNVDLSRTVGWFTSLFPVYLKGEQHAPIKDTLIAVKEQLRRMPSQAIGYGILRYLHGKTSVREQLAVAPKASLLFNYLGQFDHGRSTEGFFRESLRLPKLSRDPRGMRAYPLEILAQVRAGQLHIQWVYSAHLHRQETIKQLAQRCQYLLQSLIVQSATAEAIVYTPSDFPQAELSQEQLGRVLAEIEGEPE